jgi:subtilisin family serine protease
LITLLLSLAVSSLRIHIATGNIALEPLKITDKNQPHNSVPPNVPHQGAIDKDLNGIQDSLEALAHQMRSTNDSAVVPVVITLHQPVANQDVDWFKALGGQVTHIYKHVTHGFAGELPVANLLQFASFEKDRLSIVEYDAPINYHLDVSVPMVRTRPLVWNSYGYLGSPNMSIAILDTGIDDSHPDVGPFGDQNLSRKIVGWHDATIDGAVTPQDYGEHGTHVAGIAAGAGAANTLQGADNIQTTFTSRLPQVGYGYMDYIDVKTPGTIRLNLTWTGSNNVLLRLYNPDGSWTKQTSGTTSPLVLTHTTNNTAYPIGRYGVLVGNLGGLSGTPFSCLETYPYQGLDDGYNLFAGVAPNSKLVGVKVFSNSGSGVVSTLIAGMDWVIENKLTYNIVVASMSVSLQNGATDTTLDLKADSLAQNGIVTVVSAGNDFPYYTVASPGTAAYVMTVAATNDQNGITDYSSNGDTGKNEYGLIKPDIAAPGGSFLAEFGNKILSVDSNDMDAAYTGQADRDPNDYQQMAGTSMAAPHVSGLAALIAQALGSWNWTFEEVLKVKMVIGMTAFETQSGEEANQPELNRGGKDSKEGYGRISADAAIEAVTMTYNIGELASSTFGSDPADKKVWARQRLAVPSSGDYDLYLYSDTPDAYGQPIILQKSINASVGAEEAITYVPPVSGAGYIVAKWVEGNGSFSLQTTSEPVQDISVVSVTSSPNMVYAGEPVVVTVKAANNGGTSESFNVTANFENVTFGILGDIGTIEVMNLESGSNTSLVFTWNTANAAPFVSYAIEVEADVLENETNVVDNISVGGPVRVRLQGDVNDNGIVNIVDLAIVARVYMTEETDPDFEPEFDLDHNGIIDILDLAIIGRNYGRTA